MHSLFEHGAAVFKNPHLKIEAEIESIRARKEEEIKNPPEKKKSSKNAKTPENELALNENQTTKIVEDAKGRIDKLNSKIYKIISKPDWKQAINKYSKVEDIAKEFKIIALFFGLSSFVFLITACFCHELCKGNKNGEINIFILSIDFYLVLYLILSTYSHKYKETYATPQTAISTFVIGLLSSLISSIWFWFYDFKENGNFYILLSSVVIIHIILIFIAPNYKWGRIPIGFSIVIWIFQFCSFQLIKTDHNRFYGTHSYSKLEITGISKSTIDSLKSINKFEIKVDENNIPIIKEALSTHLSNHYSTSFYMTIIVILFTTALLLFPWINCYLKFNDFINSDVKNEIDNLGAKMKEEAEKIKV